MLLLTSQLLLLQAGKVQNVGFTDLERNVLKPKCVDSNALHIILTAFSQICHCNGTKRQPESCVHIPTEGNSPALHRAPSYLDMIKAFISCLPLTYLLYLYAFHSAMYSSEMPIAVDYLFKAQNVCYLGLCCSTQKEHADFAFEVQRTRTACRP